MTIYTKIFIILFTLLAQSPQLLTGWPQRITRQQPPAPPVPMSSCNVTFVAESRAGRPPFPDPTMDGDDAAIKERTDRVIFPDQKAPPSKLNFPDGLRDRTGTAETFVPQVPSMDRSPSCAEGSTFCTDSDNYPRNHVASIIKKEGSMYRDFFGEDVPIEPNITQRLDTSPDETPLCLSLEQVVYPKMALNKDDKWLFIVNQDQFVQGVRVEKCMKEGSCALTDSLPIGYKTSCRQKYIYRKLLSLNSDGKAISDSFRIPSCCACYYRMSGGVASRFGAPQTTLVGRGNRGGLQSPSVDSQPSTQLSRPRTQDMPRAAVSSDLLSTTAPLAQDKVTRPSQAAHSSRVTSTSRGSKFTNHSRNHN